MIWVNIDSPSLAYINKGGTNNYLQVDIGESVNAQGAKVTVVTPEGTLTEWLVTGEGLASDQTALLHFGLGTTQKVNKITVNYSNDTIYEINNPKINSVINVMEDIEKSKISNETN